MRTKFPVERLLLSIDRRDSFVSDRVSLPGYRSVGLNLKKNCLGMRKRLGA